MTITTCPDCGASPADSRCECDYMGVRAKRRYDDLFEACKKAMTCSLNSDVRMLVSAAIKNAKVQQ